jgi:hypothetical protein
MASFRGGVFPHFRLIAMKNPANSRIVRVRDETMSRLRSRERIQSGLYFRQAKVARFPLSFLL